MQHIDKEDAFWIGNIVGLVALLITVFVVAPQKERERKEFAQKQREQVQAAAVAAQVVILQKLVKKGDKIEAKDLVVRFGNAKVDPHAVHNLEDAAGKKAQHEIKAGAMLLDSDLNEMKNRSDAQTPSPGPGTQPAAEQPNPPGDNST